MAGNGNGQQTVPQAGAMVKQEFGGQTLEVRAETTATAMAAYAQATVQARFIMAERKPRSIERARVRVLEACKRPRFADEAIYNKPIGDGIEGPSIRLAEALVRELGNISVDVTVISDDREKRVISVVATDLESNATYCDSAVVDKTVERRDASGYEVISQRTNKQGKTVFIVRATDDDILNKQAAIVSKKIRTATLRLVPADILEEAMEQCRTTLEAETVKDLPGVRARVIGGFAALKPPVTVEMLNKYLGKPIEKATAVEILELRKLGVTIRDAETTWGEAMDAKFARQAETMTAPPPPLSQQVAATAPAAPAQANIPAAETAKSPAAPVASASAPAEPAPNIPENIPEQAAATEPQASAPAREISDAEKSLAEAFAKVTKRTELIAILKLITALPSEGRKQEWRQKFNQRMQELS